MTSETRQETGSVPPRVLLIAATGLSGSTLLTRMLGRVPGFVAVGETGYLWDKGLIENVECGCGERFRECPFWAEVGREAFGDWDAVDARRVTGIRDALSLRRRPPPDVTFLPLMLSGALAPTYQRRVRTYLGFMTRLYEGISKVSGGRIIVDSMKSPYHVYAVGRAPWLDVTIGHLVRDSRGVAYSRLKWVPRQGAIEGAFRARRSPIKTGIRWMWTHGSFELLSREDIPFVRVRYENLVASPRDEITRIVTGMSGAIAPGDLGFIDGDEVHLLPDHLVAGNLMRMKAGPMRLRLDDAWKTGLSKQQQRAVTAVTWPLLKRYAYA
jgi:hypothetical protein